MSSPALSLAIMELMRAEPRPTDRLLALMSSEIGFDKRLAAFDMIENVADRLRAITLGGDKGYDAACSAAGLLGALDVVRGQRASVIVRAFLLERQIATLPSSKVLTATRPVIKTVPARAGDRDASPRCLVGTPSQEANVDGW
jgi:hypothetical protein